MNFYDVRETFPISTEIDNYTVSKFLIPLYGFCMISRNLYKVFVWLLWNHSNHKRLSMTTKNHIWPSMKKRERFVWPVARESEYTCLLQVPILYWRCKYQIVIPINWWDLVPHYMYQHIPRKSHSIWKCRIVDLWGVKTHPKISTVKMKIAHFPKAGDHSTKKLGCI